MQQNKYKFNLHKKNLYIVLLTLLSAWTLQAQTIDVNVLTYNLLNYPNGNTSALDGDAARAALFRQIVENADADIIIVQEFRTANGTSAEGINNANILLTELNSNGVLGKTYAHAPAYIGYGSTTFGFLGNMLFYNANLFNFATQSEVPSTNSATTNSGNIVFTPRLATHYQLTYPKVPSCAEQITSLDVFSVHLKAGSDGATNTAISDEARRNLGALDIVDFITNNLSNTDNIIVGGDFNFRGDFESGYTTLLNGVFAPFVDPLNGWVRNISSQVARYTQSTRNFSSPINNNSGSSGGLDDRFDLWFYNNAIQTDAEKVSYNVGTYQTWASTGVAWNGRAGLGSSTIANAVELMSDHFPVYMQLQFDAPASLCAGPCPVTMHYPGPIPDGIHTAELSITSDAVINIGQDVTFMAGDFIELLPGFELMPNADLFIDIQTCIPTP